MLFEVNFRWGSNMLGRWIFNVYRCGGGVYSLVCFGNGCLVRIKIMGLGEVGVLYFDYLLVM